MTRNKFYTPLLMKLVTKFNCERLIRLDHMHAKYILYGTLFSPNSSRYSLSILDLSIPNRRTCVPLMLMHTNQTFFLCSKSISEIIDKLIGLNGDHIGNLFQIKYAFSYFRVIRVRIYDKTKHQNQNYPAASFSTLKMTTLLSNVMYWRFKKLCPNGMSTSGVEFENFQAMSWSCRTQEKEKKKIKNTSLFSTVYSHYISCKYEIIQEGATFY